MLDATSTGNLKGTTVTNTSNNTSVYYYYQLLDIIERRMPILLPTSVLKMPVEAAEWAYMPTLISDVWNVNVDTIKKVNVKYQMQVCKVTLGYIVCPAVASGCEVMCDAAASGSSLYFVRN